MREFFVADVEDATCLVARARCQSADLGRTIAKLFSDLICKGGEAVQVGAPRVVYTEWTPEQCEIEAAIPIEAGELPMGVEVKAYKGCTAFNTTHTGPYEGLAETWTLLWAEAQRRGMVGSGPPWDEYVTGPADTSDVDSWVTELYIPIEIQRL